MSTLMVMAGGTGGHVYPAMAVADHLKAEGWNIVWLATEGGMENRLIAGKNYDVAVIRMRGVRGKGLLLGAEIYADPAAKTPLPREANANVRLIDLAFERGLIVYSRRVRGGPESDNFMVCPPLIVTREEIAEIMAVLSDTLEALASEFGLPVNR